MTRDKRDKVFLNIHGIGVEIKSDKRDILKHVKSNLYHFINEGKKNPDADLNIFFPADCSTLPDVASFIKIGKDAFRSGNQFVFFDRQFIQHFIIHQNFKTTLNVFVKDLSIKKRIRKILNRNLHPNIDYFMLIRKSVIFPIFWLLEKKKGICLLHGSAVSCQERGIIFAGLAHVGKSLIGLAATLDSGCRFLTDNFLLFDEKTIYSFPELIRISPADIPLIKHIHKLGPPILKRNQKIYFQLPKEMIRDRMTLTDACIPLLAGQFKKESVSRTHFINHLLLSSDIVQEFHYYHNIGLLNSLYPSEKILHCMRIEKLKLLLKDKPLFTMMINTNISPGENFNLLIERG